MTANPWKNNSLITNIKLAGSITGDKLVNDIIVTDKIKDFNVTADKLENSAVTVSKIENGALRTQKLARLSVTKDRIAYNTITKDQIDSRTITNDRIALGTITNLELDSLNRKNILMNLGGKEQVQRIAELYADTPGLKNKIKFTQKSLGAKTYSVI